MCEKAIITFQIHQEAFKILGNENIMTESAENTDFAKIWGDFFEMGGYEPILPYATSTKPINIWYTDEQGNQIFFQGLFVQNLDKIPEGYKLMQFPAGDFLVVTTEWMETSEEAVGDAGNGRCNRYAETVEIPEGYVRSDNPIALIEKENDNTPDGSRYEVWVPIKKISLVGGTKSNDHYRSTTPVENGYVILDCYIPLDLPNAN